jgi:hypothetical protein
MAERTAAPGTTAASPPQTIDLLPAELNLLLYSGDSLEMRFTFTDSANLPVDMSGTWSAQVRTAADTADPPLADFTVDASAAATGVIDIALSSTQTQELPPESVWDLQLTLAPEHVHTTHRGSVTITEDVTRP